MKKDSDLQYSEVPLKGKKHLSKYWGVVNTGQILGEGVATPATRAALTPMWRWLLQRCRRAGVWRVAATKRASSATAATRRASARPRRPASTWSTSRCVPATHARTATGACCESTSAPPTDSSAYYTAVPADTPPYRRQPVAPLPSRPQTEHEPN